MIGYCFSFSMINGRHRLDGTRKFREQGVEYSCLFQWITNTDTAFLPRNSGKKAKAVICLEDKFQKMVSCRIYP